MGWRRGRRGVRQGGREGGREGQGYQEPLGWIQGPCSVVQWHFVLPLS